MKKVVLKRIIKYVMNGLRKVVAKIIRNKNLEVNSYLYDMTTSLKNDLGVVRRDSQYILHIGSSPICILNKSKAISVLDGKRFERVKHSLMRIGGTPKQAYQNLDSLFESKLRNGNKPVAVTIKR